jgi:hypothetical protein
MKLANSWDIRWQLAVLGTNNVSIVPRSAKFRCSGRNQREINSASKLLS